MTATPATWALIAVAGGIVLLVTLGLWARYGESIFIEAILTGIAGCFG